MSLIIIIQISIIYYGGHIFRAEGLKIEEFIFIVILATSVIPLDWVRKLFLNKNNKNLGV